MIISANCPRLQAHWPLLTWMKPKTACYSFVRKSNASSYSYNHASSEQSSWACSGGSYRWVTWKSWSPRQPLLTWMKPKTACSSFVRKSNASSYSYDHASSEQSSWACSGGSYRWVTGKSWLPRHHFHNRTLGRLHPNRTLDAIWIIRLIECFT